MLALISGWLVAISPPTSQSLQHIGYVISCSHRLGLDIMPDFGLSVGVFALLLLDSLRFSCSTRVITSSPPSSAILAPSGGVLEICQLTLDLFPDFVLSVL